MFFGLGGSNNGTATDEPFVDTENDAGSTESTTGSESSLSSWRSYISNTLGIEQQEEENEIFSFCTNLSYETRIYGFLFCFLVGTFLSISSTFFIPMILLKPSKFAIPYTLGNVLSLGSSLFFVGPKRFFKTMFNEDRRIATMIYIGALIATLISALVLHTGLLTLILILVEFASYLWLMASYIPYGRTALRATATRAFSMVSG